MESVKAGIAVGNRAKISYKIQFCFFLRNGSNDEGEDDDGNLDFYSIRVSASPYINQPDSVITQKIQLQFNPSFDYRF